MFLFTTLLFTLFTIAIIIAVAGVIGCTATLLVCGDLIVFGLFIGFIIKRFVKKD